MGAQLVVKEIARDCNAAIRTEKKKPCMEANAPIPGILCPYKYWLCDQAYMDGLLIQETEHSCFAKNDSYIGFLCEKWLSISTTLRSGMIFQIEVK